MKKSNEVMTKYPACCLPNDLVAEAAGFMNRENIGSIPADVAARVDQPEKTAAMVKEISRSNAR